MKEDNGHWSKEPFVRLDPEGTIVEDVVTKKKVIKAKFEMSLWQRIKAACGVWWAIVVTKELDCIDDEPQVNNMTATKEKENGSANCSNTR